MTITALLLMLGAGIVLSLLELVLVVDNALVIILMCAGLPNGVRERTTRTAIMIGACIRIGLIFCMGYLKTLSTPIPYLSELLEQVNGHEFSITSAVNFVGGAILVAMAAHHIHREWAPHPATSVRGESKVWKVLLKCSGASVIFSIDSVMSAVGMVDNLYVAGGSVALAAVGMIFCVNRLSDVLSTYPDLKSLGLSFVLLIGVILVAESFGYHVPKVLIYLPLGFALFVQVVDILRARSMNIARVTTAPPDQFLAQFSTEELQQALNKKRAS